MNDPSATSTAIIEPRLRPAARLAIAGCLIACGGLLYWSFARAEAAPVPPSLEIRAETLDIGEQWVRTDLPWAIELVNPGDAPIEIVDIGTSCDCTTVTERAFVIPPGESQEVPLMLDLSTPNQEPVHEFSTDLAFFVAGEPRPRQWTLSGEVRRAFAVNPPFVDFRDRLVFGGPAETVSVKITPLADLERIDLSYDEKLCLATIEKTPNGEFLLAITPSNQLAVGRHDFVIELQGALSGAGDAPPPLTLRCGGYSVSDLRAIPSNVADGVVKVGSTITTVVQVVSRTGSQPENIEFEADEGVLCRLLPGSKDRFEVTVQVLPGMQRRKVWFSQSGHEGSGHEGSPNATNSKNSTRNATFAIDYFGQGSEGGQ